MYRAKLTKKTTPKEWYNHIVAAFYAGSFPSYGNKVDEVEYEGCLYRGKDGETACVVGIAIPDDKYEECMETGKKNGEHFGINASSIIEYLGKENYPDFFFNRNEDGYGRFFIDALQRVHDKHAENKVLFDANFLTDLKNKFTEYGFEV